MSLIKRNFKFDYGEVERTFIHSNKITQFNNFAFQDQQVLSHRTLQRVSLQEQGGRSFIKNYQSFYEK